jgi:DNA-binding PadR family transcriptional regulator
LKTRVLSFALRATGATGVAFQEFARWMSPWGWSRKDLSPVLRDLEEEGLTELTEDPDGEILALRLTRRGERQLAARAGR